MKNKQISGYATALMEVNINDTKDICRLRNNPKNNKYLSSNSFLSKVAQKHWLVNNKIKEDNIYFKIINLGKSNIVGTASIYSILNKSGEFGRYICESTIQAIESEYLILKYGFEVLRLEKLYCRTVIENKKVWKQHLKFGFIDSGTEVLEKRNFKLKIQLITKTHYDNYDYAPILNLIKKLTDN